MYNKRSLDWVRREGETEIKGSKNIIFVLLIFNLNLMNRLQTDDSILDRSS